MNDRLYYLAAPYSHSTPEVVEDRMEEFKHADQHLIKSGFMTVSPLYKHWIVKDTVIPTDWEYWSKYSKSLLHSCDTLIIIMIDGWSSSTGVIEELRFAVQNSMNILFFDPVSLEFNDQMATLCKIWSTNTDSGY